MQNNSGSSSIYDIEYLNQQLDEKMKSKVPFAQYQKVQNILKILNEDIIDLTKLRKYANEGIPDECIGLRAIIWKLLLGYLIPDKSKWLEHLKERRTLYNQFLEEFLTKYKTPPQVIIDEHKKQEMLKQQLQLQENFQSENEKQQSFNSSFDINASIQINHNCENQSLIKNLVSSNTEDLTSNKINTQIINKNQKDSVIQVSGTKNSLEFKKVSDHPLSNCSRSNWNSYFKDSELFSQIEKDTERTRSDMHFFISPTKRKAKLLIPFITQIRMEKKKKNINNEERHCDVLSRILFIYAKLNPVIKYVQGMNEILATIYYVFQNERAFSYFQEDGFLQIEADSFYCFSIIMGLLKDRFMKQMDEYQQGIKYKCIEFKEHIKTFDAQLWNHFEKLEIDPQYYSLRWLLLLYTQDFKLPDATRLWDTLISQKDILNYAYYIGLAILKIKRVHLMQDDFANVMINLQKIDNIDIIEIIKIAYVYEQLHISYKKKSSS